MDQKTILNLLVTEKENSMEENVSASLFNLEKDSGKDLKNTMIEISLPLVISLKQSIDTLSKVFKLDVNVTPELSVEGHNNALKEHQKTFNQLTELIEEIINPLINEIESMEAVKNEA